MPNIPFNALRFALLASLALPAAAQAAVAQDRDNGQDAASGAQPDDSHDIIVTGHTPKGLGLMEPSAVLQGDALVADARGQLGEILARMPGVSATGFAPGASRPVLRGLDGDRIRVLVDGIGTIDASSVSVDHGVVFDPLSIDHIDVVHGPASLLYGGQAIGGAINAIDRRIPRKIPDRITSTVIASHATAARENALSGAVDVPLADRWAMHLDAAWRKSADLRAGGFIYDAGLRDSLLAQAADLRAGQQTEAADALASQALARGKIANSAARSLALGAGLAFIDAGGNLGLSVQRYTTRYGVPMRPGYSPEGEADPVSIAMEQTRVDLRGAIALGGPFRSFEFRGAYGDYRHTEFDGDEAGTLFKSAGYEFRADLIQQEMGGWTGQTGIQVQYRRLAIIGTEAFAPDNAADRIGLFTLQSISLPGGFGIDASARLERARIKTIQPGFSRTYTLPAAALGVSWKPATGWKFGLNLITGSRAPAPEELLADGLHAATQSYELGNPAFRTERSNGAEIYLKYDRPGLHISATGYATRFSRFIAALPTGGLREGLPIFAYDQHDARIKGFEASLAYDAISWDNGALRIEASADYTHARLTGIGPVPRIPPLRTQVAIEVENGDLVIRTTLENISGQKRIAAFEAPTKAFTVLGFEADWHPHGDDGPLTIMLSADNLLDVVGRRSSSFTHQFVPIAGRDIRVTAKLNF